MVSGVITGVRRPAGPSAHDAPGAPVAGTWRPHGVFAVVPAPFDREHPLPVAEHRAVLVVGERSALADQFVGLLALPRYFGDPYGGRKTVDAVHRPLRLRDGSPEERDCQESASKRKL